VEGGCTEGLGVSWRHGKASSLDMGPDPVSLNFGGGRGSRQSGIRRCSVLAGTGGCPRLRLSLRCVGGGHVEGAVVLAGRGLSDSCCGIVVSMERGGDREGAGQPGSVLWLLSRGRCYL
jgi:hypothetical protein